MTTQNSYPEHSDVNSFVVEDASVSETTASSPSSSVDAPVGEETFAPSNTEEAPLATSDARTASTAQNEQGSAAFPAEQSQAIHQPDDAMADEAGSAQDTIDEESGAEIAAEFAAEIVAETGTVSSDDATEQGDFAYTGGIPVVEEEVRPFTEIIEEFRQAEARFSAALEEARTEIETGTQETLATSSAVEEVFVPEFTMPWDASQTETAPTTSAVAEASTSTADNVEQTGAGNTGNAPQTATTPETPRPVSPLLRPATRLRVPRHSARQRDEARIANAQPTQSAQQPTEAKIEPATPKAEATQATQAAQSAEVAPEEPPRPARRYRFDRPASTTPPAAPVAPTPASTPTVPVRSESSFVNGNGHGGPNGQSGRSQTVEREAAQQPEQNTTRAITPEPTVEKQVETAQTAQTTPTTPVEPERRRKHGQERQRGKEHGASQSVSAQETPVVAQQPQQPQQPAPTEVADVAALVNAQPAADVSGIQNEEVAPEDLPPLEYADLQKASTRRRRRRHTNGASVAALTGNTPVVAPVKPATTEVSTPATSPMASAIPPAPTAQTTPSAVPQRPAATPPVAPITANGGQYGITSGFTVSQMNNGDENRGPFMGPEPSPARGTMAAQNVRSIRTDVQRTPAYPVRSTEATSASVNQLANIVAQAIQTQTDRMIAELRRSNQAPTNISVSMPPFPSTERVGVFVDVANLLYSARTLRMTVDFGKLLDFLRGNRRLVRAQAYCPTSPQPGDEQMFLQAVKGLGYRITTKNYKTFSSGAKKADLDLDLCMDVVRLVDGKAVDCIVLVSGDSDFMPMLDYCSDHGVRVEVAAFDEAMSATLRQSCDLFINLSMLDEIRA